VILTIRLRETFYSKKGRKL